MVGAVVLSTAMGLAAVGWNLSSDRQAAHAAEGTAPPTPGQLARVEEVSDAFQKVAESMKPSVVSISTKKTFRPQRDSRRRSTPQLPPGIPDEFRRFFNDDLFDRFGQMPEGSFERSGLGSGVVVSADGYILTNNHVVGGADEVTITMFDDRQVSAKIVGTDAKTDVAVLKVDVGNLTPAKLGNSDQTKVGQWVLAIGSPFGLEQTVTAGIISAKSRATGVILADGYEDFLQTDAAINPGNSGGPLVNLRGEVIGINTAIFGGSGNVGVGFAIPSNMASNIMQSIISTGTVVRGWLGASIQPLNEGLAESFGFAGTRGVLIAGVLPDSPAEKSGLREGDIVTELNGRAVTTPGQLSLGIASLKPNSKANLAIFRDNAKRNIQVMVGEMARSGSLPEEPQPIAHDTSVNSKLGLNVRTLTEEIASELGYKGEVKGVVVAQVESGSLAGRAGIQPGDIILTVGSKSIGDIQDFRSAMSGLDLKAGARMQIARGELKRFVFLRGAE
jgi:serine protease Do